MPGAGRARKPTRGFICTTSARRSFYSSAGRSHERALLPAAGQGTALGSPGDKTRGCHHVWVTFWRSCHPPVLLSSPGAASPGRSLPADPKSWGKKLPRMQLEARAGAGEGGAPLHHVGCLRVLGWIMGRWEKLTEEQSSGGGGNEVRNPSPLASKHLENTGGKRPVVSRHPLLGSEAADGALREATVTQTHQAQPGPGAPTPAPINSSPNYRSPSDL